MKHAFEKSSRGLSSSRVEEQDINSSVCGVCKNLWQLNVKVSKPDTASSYSCENCDLLVHSSCRMVANETSPCCVYKGHQGEMCTLRLESTSNSVVSTHSIAIPGSSLHGKVYLSVLRAYNLHNINEETQLYCMFRIGTNHQSNISPSATAKDNECIWNLVDDPNADQSDLQHFVTSIDPQKTYNVSTETYGLLLNCILYPAPLPKRAFKMLSINFCAPCTALCALRSALCALRSALCALLSVLCSQLSA
jgi:hypothetical protein